jgi:hypothetical protein
MSNDTPLKRDYPLFTEIFRQNWENVRNIKTERMWLMNTFSAITAAVLSLIQAMHLASVLQVSLIIFMCLFSIMGLLTSLRLKAELEECLAKIGAMVAEAKEREFVALGDSDGELAHYPKFRWVFPLFFSMSTAGFVSLLIYRLMTGPSMK